MATARVCEGTDTVGKGYVRVFNSLLVLAVACGGGKASGNGSTDTAAADPDMSRATARGGSSVSGADVSHASGGFGTGNASNVNDAGGMQHEAGVGSTGSSNDSAGASQAVMDAASSVGVGGQGASEPSEAVVGTATTGGGLGVSSGGAGRDEATTGGSAGSGQGGTIARKDTSGSEPCAAPTATAGTPITFNDDGVWFWYQDERAIVDPEASQLIIGSIACSGSRSGDVEVTSYDLARSDTPQRSTLGSVDPGELNAPALIKVTAGTYLAVYTTCNDECFSYYNVYQNGAWGEQGAFDWGPLGCPTSYNRTVSFSNLWPLSGKIYNFVRSYETSPNLITTTDGSSFTYAGRLTGTPRADQMAGYYKYWGDGLERIDFVGTEAHPRDNDNSLYHGYIKATGGTIRRHDSLGNEKGDIDLASQTNSPEITEFTKIFAAGTTINGVTLTHLWNHDITRYDDGTIVVLGQGRVAGSGTDDPDIRFIYMRFDGAQWRATYLVRGGRKLLANEQDYTGLSAIHPNDPHTIYVSTTYDPRDDRTQTSKREIWRGTTCDQGKTFAWTSITKNSTLDNVRPIVPDWPGGKTALLWLKGYSPTASECRSAIVGLIMDGS